MEAEIGSISELRAQRLLAQRRRIRRHTLAELRSVSLYSSSVAPATLQPGEEPAGREGQVRKKHPVFPLSSAHDSTSHINRTKNVLLKIHFRVGQRKPSCAFFFYLDTAKRTVIWRFSFSMREACVPRSYCLIFRSVTLGLLEIVDEEISTKLPFSFACRKWSSERKVDDQSMKDSQMGAEHAWVSDMRESQSQTTWSAYMYAQGWYHHKTGEHATLDHASYNAWRWHLHRLLYKNSV